MTRRWILALLPLFVACSGGGTASTGHACPALVVSLSDPVIAPVDGSTGVPVTIGTLRFSRPQFTIDQPVTLTPSNGGAAITTATPPFDEPATNTIAVNAPTLAARTTYVLSSASLTAPSPSNVCGMNVDYRMGSFTTQ